MIPVFDDVDEIFFQLASIHEKRQLLSYIYASDVTERRVIHVFLGNAQARNISVRRIDALDFLLVVNYSDFSKFAYEFTGCDPNSEHAAIEAYADLLFDKFLIHRARHATQKELSFLQKCDLIDI